MTKITWMVMVGIALFAAQGMADVLSHWTFDSDYTDSGSTTNHGTLDDVGTIGDSGIVTNDTKFGGGAMNFAVEEGFYDDINLSLVSMNYTDFTVSFWANKDGTHNSNHGTVIGYEPTTTYDHIGLYYGGSGIDQLRWRGHNTLAGGSGANWNVTRDSEWHHYVIVGTAGATQGTGTVEAYRDGVSLGVVSNLGVRMSYDAIGAGNQAHYNFDGQLDEVWVFDEAITAGQVQGLMHNNEPVEPPADVLSHWTFDSDYTDFVGSNDGTLDDNGTIGDSGITTISGEYKFGDGAMGFGIDDDKIDVTQVSRNYVDWSVSFWANKDGTNPDNNGSVIGYDATTATDYIGLYWGGVSGKDQLRWRGHNTLAGNYGADWDVTRDSEWHHYVIVGTAGATQGTGTVEAYQDGVSLGVRTDKGVRLAYTAIGGGRINYGFDGQLDEVWVFKIAVTAGQVRGLMLNNEPVELPYSGILLIIQ